MEGLNLQPFRLLTYVFNLNWFLDAHAWLFVIYTVVELGLVQGWESVTCNGAKTVMSSRSEPENSRTQVSTQSGQWYGTKMYVAVSNLSGDNMGLCGNPASLYYTGGMMVHMKTGLVSLAWGHYHLCLSSHYHRSWQPIRSFKLKKQSQVSLT